MTGTEARVAVDNGEKEQMASFKKQREGPNANKMLACIQTGYSPDYTKSCQWTCTHDIPEPKNGEVLIKICYAASNPIDYKIASGALEMVQKIKFPLTMGRDYSGIVAALDSSKTPSTEQSHGLKVGDRVCGLINIFTAGSRGSFAEYVTMPGHTVVKIPDTMSLQQAAGLGLASQTTYQSLKDIGGLMKGLNQKVLILGGTTATGTLGLNMCRDFGCSEVCCTSSQEEVAKSNGATEVFNYKKGGDWSELWKGKDFDIVYDCVGGPEAWQGAQKVLKTKGRFVTIVGDFPNGKFTAGRLASTAGALFRRKFRQTFGSRHFEYHAHFVKEPADGLRYFVSLVDKYKTKTLDEKVPYFEFSIEGGIAMYKKQESGTAKGKMLMKIFEPSEASGSPQSFNSRNSSFNRAEGGGGGASPGQNYDGAAAFKHNISIDSTNADDKPSPNGKVTASGPEPELEEAGTDKVATEPAEPKQEEPAEPKQEEPAEPQQEEPTEPKQEEPILSDE